MLQCRYDQKISHPLLRKKSDHCLIPGPYLAGYLVHARRFRQTVFEQRPHLLGRRRDNRRIDTSLSPRQRP